MSFNIFATATSDIPLANLDANFTMIGSSAVASTLYPTATTSITYGTAGTIHYFSGSGLAVTGTLSSTLAITTGTDVKVADGGYIYSPTGSASGTVKAGIQLNGSGSITSKISDVTVTTISSTGLAVTGTLSATGLISSSLDAAIVLDVGGGARVHHYAYTDNGGSGITNTNPYTSGAMVYLEGGSTKIYSGASLISTTSSTGLAVTGLISSTGSGTYQIASDGAGDTTFQIGPNAPSATRSGRIGFTTSSNTKNWFIANNWYVGGALEFSQTTTVGGITMSGTPSMLLDASGNLLVGATTNPNGIKSRVKATNGDQFELDNAGNQFTSFYLSNDGTIKVSSYWDNTNAKYQIVPVTNGVYLSSGGVAWVAVSDERFKDIIEPIENATDKLSGLRTIVGKYKTDEEGIRRSFLIAQDVQAVFPEAVDSTNQDELGLRYQDLIPVLVKAIQELSAKVTALENK